MKGVAAVSPGVARFVDDVPAPEPDEYGCLVRNIYCGYCNTTDTRIIDGIDAGDLENMPFPKVIGHEGVGIVEKVGKKVRHIKPGDRYIRPYTSLKYGKYGGNSGNMCEYNLGADRLAMEEDGIPAEKIPTYGRFIPLPDGISDLDAAVLVPLVECVSAVHNFGLTGREKVLVVGAGPMGLGVCAYLKILGADVTVADRVKWRLEYAKEKFGLRTVLTDGPVDAFFQKGSFDAAIDLAGFTEILRECSFLIRQGGTLCSMGTLSKIDRTLDITKLQNHISLHILSYPYEKMASFPELIGLIRSGKIRPSDFYSDVMSFYDIEKCVAMNRRHETVKVVLEIE
ncbi:MAG: zinc-binding dehydrogenase [Clostridia bacterium]|nr:zinc-binding dehydrogenase [Clostridia bacterium]